MKLKLLRRWRHYTEGRVLDVNPGVADVLIRRGTAERVAEGPAPPKPAPAPANRRK
jgi:hypothetical protein